MKRSGYIQRKTRLRAGKPSVRKARPKAETTRVYGTDAHQAWLRDCVCLICFMLPVELAHTANGGMGRKADASTLVPLCAGHHRELHQTGVRSFERRYDINLGGHTLAAWAQSYARAWEHYRKQPKPLSAIVPRVVADIIERSAAHE